MNRKLNTKWLGAERVEKERKLHSKAGDKNKSKLEGLLARADKIRKEIRALEKNNSASIKLNIIAEQIVDTAENKERVTKILDELSSGTTKGDENLQKWANFQEEYLKGKEKKADGSDDKTKWGIYSLADELGDNHYPINWKGKIYDSNESLGAERIAYEVTHQLAKIDLVKLSSEATKIVAKGKDTSSKKATAEEKKNADKAQKYLEWIPTNKNKLEGHLSNVKKYAEKMTTAGCGQQGRDKDGKKVGKPWAFEYREFSDKERIFDFNELDSLVNMLAPAREEGHIDFINQAMGKTWADDQKWHIWTAAPLTEEKKKEYVKNKKVPAYYGNKGKVIYWSDEKTGGNGSNNITLKGLGGWIELYGAIFNNSANRTKFVASQQYIQKFSQMYRGLIYKGTDFDSDISLTKTENRFVADFKNRYGVEIQEVYDEDGNLFYLPLTYDVEDIKRRLRAQNTKLTALEKGLGENDMTNQGKLENEQNASIYVKQDELEKLDVEINDLMTKDEVKEKIQKLNELKKVITEPANATVANKVDWGREEVIITAAKVEKLLLDIAWLQNGGIDGTKDIKEDESIGMKKKDVTDNLALIYEIEQQRNQMGDAWDIVIKGEFERGGKDTKTRIDKAEKEDANGGVGLETIRDSLKRLNKGNDSEVAEEIGKRLDKAFVASDSKDLTSAELNSALGISDSTHEMVDAWAKLANGWGKLEANIKGLFSDYSENTKKTALITYLKGLDNADIKAASSDDDKFVAFKKQSPEFIIEHLVRHENSKALADVKSDEAKLIITRMKAVSGGVDTNTYGDPENPKTIDSNKLYTFLFDEKIDNITKSTSQDGKDRTEGNAFVNHIKKHWGWYLGGTLVLVVGAIAIFWKSISEWWNGPAEEGSESEKNQDEDNE